MIALTSLLVTCRDQTPDTPLRKSIYVWQRDWGPETAASIRAAAETADAFWILAGEAAREGEQTSWSMTRPDWPALAQAAVSGAGVSIVFRMNAGFVPVLAERGEARQALIDDLSARAGQIRALAAENGVHIDSFQLDYDCPTARLADYARFTRDLRDRATDLPLWTTTLPTWLDSPNFGALADASDGFVLQAHSIEPPRSIDEAAVLCDVKKVPRWIARAVRHGRPFVVSLPTYGYHVIFDDKGAFVGIMAERELSLDPSAQYIERTAQADPMELAGVISQLRDRRPANCLGVAWFRLPVASDQMNWPWLTLRAVMDGREPQYAFAVQLSNPGGDADLFDIHVTNAGEGNPGGAIRFSIDWKGREYVASDLLNGYAEDASGALTGPAPDLDNSIFVGWYRFASTDTPLPAPETGKIEALP